MRYPVDIKTCYTLSTTGNIAQKYFELMKDDELETLISQGIGVDKDGNFEVLDDVSHDDIIEHCKALHGAAYLECVTPKLEDVREDPVPPTQLVLPSQSQSVTRGTSLVSHIGKRKRTTLPTIIEDGSEKNETASEIHSPQKKKDESEVKPARSLFIVDHEIQPGEIWDGVAVLEPPSPKEDEKLKCDLLFLLDPALNTNDRQHLLNAASVFKSNLVACFTSSADTMRTKDMINLASRCYNILGELGDDYTLFHSEIKKLISQHQKVEFAAKDKENWNEWDIEARYIHQVQFLSEARQKLSSAQDELSTAKTKEEDERVKTLTGERDQFQEAHSNIEVGIVKLDAEKKEASVAFEAFNTAKEEFERISTHLLQLVKQKGGTTASGKPITLTFRSSKVLVFSFK
ncbi:hypothetical protein POM88_034696 [Heracleum sosnowskyi]|uniref:Uncharacterized protein n=1 Tax=Heracleum sosnowskyi TaxID=360622 RepID=A0AAD8HK27_9APIA|nr:hypothetical protein POM88_034696 [Heracleum sosnowskyi]